MWDPVRDAESSQQERPCICCDTCNAALYPADSTHYADKCYRVGGMTLCGECAREWLKEMAEDVCL